MERRDGLSERLILYTFNHWVGILTEKLMFYCFAEQSSQGGLWWLFLVCSFTIYTTKGIGWILECPANLEIVSLSLYEPRIGFGWLLEFFWGRSVTRQGCMEICWVAFWVIMMLCITRYTMFMAKSNIFYTNL
jgi:hypothetical protein